MFSRRDFLKISSLAGAGTLLNSCNLFSNDDNIPPYMRGFETIFAHDQKKAALKWFDQARYGLFLHYGLYSQLGGYYKGKKAKGLSEWIQYHARIPVAEYAKLADTFTAEKFDADFITDLALESGMNYINITTRHHDSFCLFDSKYTTFKSTNSAAKRDLVAELAEQCSQKGLGLFFYYSHGRDWRHPHAPRYIKGKTEAAARPHYQEAQAEYATPNGYNMEIYLQFLENQVTELLTNYGPVAGIWLDGEAGPRKYFGGVEAFKAERLYKKIRKIQPQCLISYKKGLTGTEDFKAPERHTFGLSEGKIEICNTLQKKAWGYLKGAKIKSPDSVWEMLEDAAARKGNLLLNSGPRGDGSLVPEEIACLKEVGRRLKANGFPKG